MNLCIMLDLKVTFSLSTIPFVVLLLIHGIIRLYMAEILLIWRKTLLNQSIIHDVHVS